MHSHCYYHHFPGLGIINLPKRFEGLSSEGQGEGWTFKTAYFLENYNGTDD